MRIVQLKTVDAVIAFDLECPTSGGGTRMAPDITWDETALLARAMTYKLAILRQRTGGAKAGIRASQADRDAVLARFCEEIRPLVERQEFLTAADLGTYPQDFASLRSSPTPLHTENEAGVPLDAELTGLGVIAAADAAIGGLAGCSLAIEGFGKIGGATAVEAARQGGRLVAVSTVHGAVCDPAGFELEELLELRRHHGDRCVERLGQALLPAEALYESDADVLVPGARTGVLDAARAARVRARVVAPAANVPYTVDGLATLQAKGVVALPDFVCNAGATIGYLAENAGRLVGAHEIHEVVDRTVRDIITETAHQPDGAFTIACALAEQYLRTWRDPDGMPDGPPLAPDGD